MITRINPRNQQFKICEINAATRRGQAIAEYLAVWAVVVAAIGVAIFNPAFGCPAAQLANDTVEQIP